MASQPKKGGHVEALALLELFPHIFAGLITILVAIFALTIDIRNVWAGTPEVSKTAVQLPLNASTDASILTTLNLLRRKTENNGTTRIIVGLRVAFTPEGALNPAAAALQRSQIAEMQTAVLEKVPSLTQTQRRESIKRYKNIPFMALEVNAAELEMLAGLDEIASIEADRIAAPASETGTIKQEEK